MKKAYLLLFVLVVILIASSAFLFGRYTTQKNPVSEIRVTSPVSGSEIPGPFTVEGEVKGWDFDSDGSFSAVLEDSSGRQITAVPAWAIDSSGRRLILTSGTTENWVRKEFVPFKAEFDFDIQSDMDANIVLSQPNLSNKQRLEFVIPVKLKKPTEFMTVKVFFLTGPINPDDNSGCTTVSSVNRQIPKTNAVAQAALHELLKGPTPEELANGYGTEISPGVKVNKIVLEGDTIWIDFSKKFSESFNGVCRSSGASSQLYSTLGQFPGIKNIEISVDGVQGWDV